MFILNEIIWHYSWGIYNSKYEAVNMDAKYFVFADSHGENLIGGRTDFCNLSFPNDSYIEIYKKVKYILKKGKPKMILISVDDHMLNSCRASYFNKERVTKYCFKEDYDNFYEYVEKRLIRYNISYFNPRHLDLLKWYIKNRNYDFFNGDTLKLIQTWDKVSETKKLSKMQNRFKEYYSSKSQIAEDYLIKIIKLCESHSVLLAGVKFPHTKQYQDNYLKKWDSDMLEILEMHDVPTINGIDFNSSNHKLFLDQEHLNIIGGTLFYSELQKVAVHFLKRD